MGQPHNNATIPGYGVMDNKYLRLFEQQVSKLIGDECWLEVQGHGRAKMNYFAHGSRIELAIHTNNANNRIAYCSMLQMPGCCGICISTGNYVEHAYRKKGLNGIFNRFRIDLARHLGYTTLLCTDITSNAAQRKTLAKNGWRDVYAFKNRRTNNEVNISLVDVFNVPPIKHPRSWVQDKAKKPVINVKTGTIIDNLVAVNQPIMGAIGPIVPIGIIPAAQMPQPGVGLPGQFLFRTQINGPVVDTAMTLNEMYYVIKTCAPGAIHFHGQRGDFSQWIKDALHNQEVGSRVFQAELNNLHSYANDIEHVREALLSAIDGPPNQVDDSS